MNTKKNIIKTITAFSVIILAVITIEVLNFHYGTPSSKAHFNFGFGYVGTIFLLMLFIPNIIWTRFLPEGYMDYAKNENKILGIVEKAGEAGATVLLPFFTDFNFDVKLSEQKINFPVLNYYIILAFVLMILYEIYWIRYFKSEHTMKDFYKSISGIPLAGATLPVMALFLLGLYARNPALIPVSVILGIGHIGIHFQHFKEIQ